jgi:hypothetical protein
VIDILREGTASARALTGDTLAETQEKMGLVTGLIDVPPVPTTGVKSGSYLTAPVNLLYVP